MTPADRLAGMRRVAEAATPGPWEAFGATPVMAPSRPVCAIWGPDQEYDATHIATFDPPTVLALLDGLRWAHGELWNDDNADLHDEEACGICAALSRLETK